MSRIGLSESLPMRVGLHQGSALSPYIFTMVMYVIAKDIIEPPWCLLFADDIVLCQAFKAEMEERLEKWSKAMEDQQKENRIPTIQ